MFDREILAAAEKLLTLCREKKLTIVTAESCTGGLVAGAMTEIPGSSDVVERGFVTYSNAAKETVLGVPARIFHIYGAVSQECARAMAEGALKASPADIAVSITGIAGPGGGSPAKPVGLVHFAATRRSGNMLHREMRYGDLGRSEIRRRAVLTALTLAAEAAN